MEIPHKQLDRKILRSLIESFVLREGTDYGQTEYSLDDKVAQVLALLDAGDAYIVFDPQEESCNIICRGSSKRLP